MRRDQLEHAIRTACQIIGHEAVVVVGSQSILGSFREDELPSEATMSMEIDVLPLGDRGDEIARLADQIEGVAGEWSPYSTTVRHPLRSRPRRRVGGSVIEPVGGYDRLVTVRDKCRPTEAGEDIAPPDGRATLPLRRCPLP